MFLLPVQHQLLISELLRSVRACVRAGVLSLLAFTADPNSAFASILHKFSALFLFL